MSYFRTKMLTRSKYLGNCFLSNRYFFCSSQLHPPCPSLQQTQTACCQFTQYSSLFLQKLFPKFSLHVPSTLCSCISHMSTLSRAWRLNCSHVWTFGHKDEAVLGGKSPAGKGVDSLLSWHGSHFWICITFCKVRYGDSVTKPDY